MLKVPQQCCTLRVECAWQTKPITAMVQVCTLVCTNFALIKIMKSFQLGKETLMLLSLNLNNNHLLHSSCNLQNGFTKLYFKTSHKCVVQWRSEYGTSLVFKWSKKVRCQMVQYSNAIWKPDSPTICIPDKWMPSCFILHWSGFLSVWVAHRNTELFEIWTWKSLLFKCFWDSNGWYSDSHCI